MDRLFDWLVRVATLAELLLSLTENVLARRDNDEPDNGPE